MTPGRQHATPAERAGVPFEAVTFASASDSGQVALSGWWFAGPEKAPVIVCCPRGTGTMADLLPSVREFQKRGYRVLTFDYRDFGPASPGPSDSLKYVVFASRWVDDAVGALRFARSKARGRPVFAWGSQLGGAVALAAAARHRSHADAIATEGLFRSGVEMLHFSGLSQIAGATERQRQLVTGSDEPVSALAMLQVPLLVVIAGKDAVTPPDMTSSVVRQSLSRIDRWQIPDGAHEGLELTPGYFDRMAAWFRAMANAIDMAPR